jgi:ApaG protein
MYKKTTLGVTVSVYPLYLDEQSSPEKGLYMWAYYVRIENDSHHMIQVVRRYWKIINAKGHVQEVKGEGVVGEKPIIDPGQMYEYASGTPLTTPSGFMQGFYVVECEDGSSFELIIPPFSLDSPYEQIRYN